MSAALGTLQEKKDTAIGLMNLDNRIAARYVFESDSGPLLPGQPEILRPKVGLAT